MLGDFLCAFVFFACCQATPDVAFLLVEFKYLTDLGIKGWITCFQTLLQILMNGGFGDPEFFRSFSDGGSGFNHVHSQVACPFIQCIGQINPSDAVCC